VSVKTPDEIVILREGGRRLAGILQQLIEAAQPGVSTKDLDRLAESLIFSCGGAPVFRGYRARGARVSYPASICVSINDEAVHGIPREDRRLREGDAVGIDIGMRWSIENQKLIPGSIGDKNQKGGMVTDMAVTIGIGKVSSEAERLMRTTKEALELGIRSVRPGARIGDISSAIQRHLQRAGLGVIRELAGHGVGYELHEEPLIPNYGKPGTGTILKEGMVIAIEPMATLGDWRVALQPDEWTFRTADGSLAAHFEHTVAVTAGGAEVLTK